MPAGQRASISLWNGGENNLNIEIMRLPWGIINLIQGGSLRSQPLGWKFETLWDKYGKRCLL